MCVTQEANYKLCIETQRVKHIKDTLEKDKRYGAMEQGMEEWSRGKLI